MNDDVRGRLLIAIEEMGRRYPDWRLGQMVENLAGLVDRPVYDVEDDELLGAILLHFHKREAEARRESVGESGSGHATGNA